MHNERLIYCETNIDSFNELKDKIKTNPNIRLMLMDKMYTDIYNISIKRNNEKIWLYSGKYTVKRSQQGNIYLKPNSKKGFVYNFQTKKITLWFDTSLKNIPKEFIFKFVDSLGFDWFSKMFMLPQYSNITPYIFFNKTLLEKIFNKKINNPKELLLYYSKYSLKYNTKQWKKLGMILNDNLYSNFLLANTNLCTCTTNPFDTVINVVNNNISKSECEKIFEYYNIINKKVNTHLWSVNRFHNESEHIECEMIKSKLSFLNKNSILPFKIVPIIHNRFRYEVIDNTLDLYTLYRMKNKSAHDSFYHVFTFEEKKSIYVKLTNNNGDFEIIRLVLNTLNNEIKNALDRYNLNIIRFLKIQGIESNEIREALHPICKQLINFLLENKNLNNQNDIIYTSSVRFEEMPF